MTGWRRRRAQRRCLHGAPDGGTSWVHTIGAPGNGRALVACLQRFGGCGQLWEQRR